MQTQINQLASDLFIPPGFTFAFLFAIGLCLGSFLNVLIYRLPIMIEGAVKGPFNLMTPKSRCQSCQAPIGAVDNIPLLSFLNLQGRCRVCRESISLRYPAIELISGLSLVYSIHHFPTLPLAICAYIFVMLLMTLTLIDWDTLLLPDALTLPLICLGLIVNYYELLTDFNSAIIGAGAGYFILWLSYWCFRLVTNKEGMGYGDFKLLSGIGAWLGWKSLLPTLILSSMTGALFGLYLIYFEKRDRQQPIPFGPFLSGGAIFYLFAGKALSAFYL